MALFRRNRKDDHGDEDVRSLSDDFESGKRKVGRPRKKKHEPWGKKERLIVLSLLFLTVGTSAFLSASARNWKLPGLPRFKIPEFSMPFMEEKTIVITGSEGDTVKANKAQQGFKELTDDLSGVWGLCVVRLKNGSTYGVNEDEIFQAASHIKLPVMAAMYAEHEKGNVDLDDKYILKEEDRTGGSGNLYGKPAGYSLTYRDIVRFMGKQSDNTAYNIALKTLGGESVEEVIRRAGMISTSLDENETTPKDICTFFEELWKGNIVSISSRDEILNFLTDTIYEDHLSAGIPKEIKVAHKYGRETHVVNDAGIIFVEEPFVMVILSEGVVEAEADKIFPDLVSVVYGVESGR